MELSSKQRAYLRSLSNELDVIVHIGKDGIGENLVKQANDALEAGAGHRHQVRALPPLAQKGQEGQDRAAQGGEEDRLRDQKENEVEKFEDRNLRRQLQPAAPGSSGRGGERGEVFAARQAHSHPCGYPAAQGALRG